MPLPSPKLKIPQPQSIPVSPTRQKKPMGDMLSSLGILPVSESETLMKCLFYGKSGTGKTTLAATFPRPILYLQCDKQGTTSIRRQKDVFFKQFETFEEFEEIYLALEDDRGAFFKTVVLDTVTSWQELVMGNVNTGTNELISQQTWGKCSNKMKTYLMNLLDLPVNVIILAQERVPKEEDSNNGDVDMVLPEVGPYTMPSVTKILNAAVSIIGQTYIRASWIKSTQGLNKRKLQAEYCLRIGPHVRYVTKVRRDSLSAKGDSEAAPEYIINPTYEKLMEVVMGEDDKYIEEVKVRRDEEEAVNEEKAVKILNSNSEEE